MRRSGRVVDHVAGEPPRGGSLRRLVRAALVVASSLSVACGDGPGRAGDAAATSVTVTVDTVAGVEVVRSAGEAPRWALDTLLSLGSVGGAGEPEEDEFGRVPDVTVGPGGALYVPDMQNAEVKVFRADGTLQATIGREGLGPGEFSSLYSLAWVGDTLLALDYGAARVGLLSAGGDWLGTRPAMGRISGPPAELGFFPVGPTEVYQMGFEVRDDRFHRSWLRHGLDTVVAVRPYLELELPPLVECHWAGGVFGFFEHRFAVRVHQHPAPGGNLWTGRSDRYRLVLLSPEGDTVRVVERELAPEPVADGAWDGVLADFEAWRDRYDAPDCDPSAPRRPETAPFFRTFQVDLEGRLWVERMIDAGFLWEVFDRNGALVGAVPGFEYDADRTNPYLGGGEVAWIAADSALGIPRVHRARILKETTAGRRP